MLSNRMTDQEKEHASSIFQIGNVVRIGTGEYLVASYDGLDSLGREVYTVTSAITHTTKDGRPYNQFKAVVIPTLTLTGVAWEQFS